ncbi:MAG: late competence development ComFB family protein [Firmicutes bacterium]|nr:late competence development ComFB family protein [Bacillota bacterium]
MKDDFVSKNISEDLLDLHLNTCLNSSNVCVCERCRADIRALALNAMQPHYVVTELGDAYVRLEAMTTQSQADIITAIIQAINIVKQNPRHDQ